MALAQNQIGPLGDGEFCQLQFHGRTSSPGPEFLSGARFFCYYNYVMDGGQALQELWGKRGKSAKATESTLGFIPFRPFPFSPFSPFPQKIGSHRGLLPLAGGPGRGGHQDRLISPHDRVGRGHGPDGLGRGAGGPQTPAPGVGAARGAGHWWTPGATGSKRPTP